MKTLVPATISKINTMADKSIRIQVDTQELSAEKMAEVFGLYGQYGYFYFNEQAEKAEFSNLPPVKTEKGEKTKAQRLRGVLYRLWEQTTKSKTFEEYYNFMMEEIINFYKGKLS